VGGGERLEHGMMLFDVLENAMFVGLQSQISERSF
jgi:hypothetical protein